MLVELLIEELGAAFPDRRRLAGVAAVVAVGFMAQPVPFHALVFV